MPALRLEDASSSGIRQLRVVPMGLARYGENFIKRQDPKGRDYFWATTDPPPCTADPDTDLAALEEGNVTLTPLDFDLTRTRQLETMRTWGLDLSAS